MNKAWIRNAIGLCMVLLPGLAPSFVRQRPQPVQAIKPPKDPLPAESASESVTRFSFLVYGDTRGRSDGTAVQYQHSLVVDSMLAAIRRLQPTDAPVRFVIQTGDAVVNGGDARQWNVSFVSLINKLTTDGGVPYFLAPGNHDVTAAETLNSAQRQTALRNYLQATAQLIPPDGAPRRLDGYPTYAFGYGNTFFLALDSNIAGDDTQFKWAKAQLEGLDRKRFVNVMVFFHHPIFSSGPHGGPTLENPTAILRRRYMPLFRTHHVCAVLTGHEHLYEHWIERYADASGTHRMDMIVTGGGGAPLYAYQGEPETATYLRSNAAAQVQLEHLVRPAPQVGDNPYHFVTIRVDGENLSLEVTGVDRGAAFRPYPGSPLDLN